MFLRAFSRGEQTLEIKSHARLKGDVKKNGENVFSGRVFLLVSRLMMSLFEYMAGLGGSVLFWTAQGSSKMDFVKIRRSRRSRRLHTLRFRKRPMLGA